VRTFRVINAEQRSDVWLNARRGRVTGTSAAGVLAKNTTAAYLDLKARLIVERLTGEVELDTFTNDAMAWGTAHEDEARIAYEMRTGFNVQETGFLEHTELMAGVSLDGHIGDFNGLIELKCPYKKARHLAAFKGVPAEYRPQIQHALWLTGAEWCDFISYDPRFPEPLRVVVHRVHRNHITIADYESVLRGFLREVDTELAALATMTNPAAVLTAALEA
jgi:putative phage-type endonuclease